LIASSRKVLGAQGRLATLTQADSKKTDLARKNSIGSPGLEYG